MWDVLYKFENVTLTNRLNGLKEEHVMVWNRVVPFERRPGPNVSRLLKILLTPKRDQDRFSHNVNTTSNRHIMKVNKTSFRRLLVDPVPNYVK